MTTRAPRRGWFERIMFSFMGPPQVGDVTAPATAPHDPQLDLCTRCRQPWDDHEHVRTASYSYLTCPPSE